MSTRGAMVESPLIPAVGTRVQLMRGALIADGVVVWTSPKRLGLKLLSEVAIQAWLASPAKIEQQRVDNIIALVRSGAIPPASTPFAANDLAKKARSSEQLVDDLGAVVSLMEGLEDELSSSNETLARHGIKLQHLDIAMQMLRAVARELSTGGWNGQAGMARLEDLRVVCAQALGTD